MNNSKAICTALAALVQAPALKGLSFRCAIQCCCYLLWEKKKKKKNNTDAENCRMAALWLANKGSFLAKIKRKVLIYLGTQMLKGMILEVSS